MKTRYFSLLILCMIITINAYAQDKPGSPEDSLPPYIYRITQFGQRPDFSHDGKKYYLSKKPMAMFMKLNWLRVKYS